MDRFQFVFVVITAHDGEQWKYETDPDHTLFLEKSLISFDVKKVASDVMDWCLRLAKIPARRCLMYTITSFELIRYPSAIRRVIELCRDRDFLGAWDKLPEGAKGSFDTWIDESMHELEKRGAFRRKPGGFVWMNYSLRAELRKRLKEHISLRDQQTIHRLIARWYGRLFIASADPRSAFAVLEHAIRGLEVWDNTVPAQAERAAMVVMLRHCRIVLKAAEEQMKRRLSEELTDRYLEDISERIEHLFSTRNKLF
jgi:hypothetical protein